MVEYAVQFANPVTRELVGKLGLDWIKRMLDEEHYLQINGTNYKVVGSYVFEDNPNTNVNVTASKL